MLLVDEVDNKEFLTELFEVMHDELPMPKQKNNGMRQELHSQRGENNHDGKCSVFFARGSAVDLDGSADRLSLCTASDPQG